jgi:hypothetical protein
MTQQLPTCIGVRGHIFQGALFTMVLTWMACGMRSDLIHASADDQGDGGGPGGAAGAGGFVVNGTGGHASNGGTGGGASSGRGGSSTGGVATTGPASGGVTTVAQGGSGGSRSGGSGGSRSGGSGGSRNGGSGGSGNGGSGGSRNGGSGGHASGGSGSGGRSGTGGATFMTPDASPRADAVEAPPPTGTPTVDPNSGYTTIATGTVVMSGYVSSSASGSGSTIGLTYNANSFCASGSVGASTTFKSWAVVGFNVNQSQSGVSGSTEPLPLTGSELTISYVNHAGSTLEFQLWDGTNFWCYFLPPSTSTAFATIPFSKLNTACWDGSGTPFTSGTAITSVQLVVPGSATSATPFDYCFLGLTTK